jgi:predicted nucleotidyltransferase component of viral defense system
MILKEEIEEQSKIQEILTADIQRDYLFSWVLNYFFTQSELKESLFLKGGNALRKAYFIKTRFSSDLDFGTPNDIDQDFLKQEIEKACQFIAQKSGISFVFERNDIKEKFNWNEPRWKVFEVKIYFNDFYGNSDHITLKISLDITRFDKTYLGIQERTLLHPYSDANDVICQIRCMQLEEILATKLKCLLQRNHAPDLFDFIYSIYLNTDIPVNKSEIKMVFLKRTIFERSPNVAKNILLRLPFEYIKAAWLKIICTRDVRFDFDDAYGKFTSEIEALFDGVTENSSHDRYFFHAETRNKIMKAGKEQTLLRVVYQGYERLVEPYSLKFQEKSDGVEKEYLYVWNISGGSSPKPGIRMFVPENLTSIENTEEKYTPRYEIELCRAGEYPEERYLYDRKKKIEKEYKKIFKIRAPKQTRYPKSRVSSFGPTYVYKCGTCGKLSYRKTMDGVLKPHKSKNGFTCYGYGIYQTTKF